MDKLTKEQRRKNMQAVKSKGSNRNSPFQTGQGNILMIKMFSYGK
jgi:hypothetical protein